MKCPGQNRMLRLALLAALCPALAACATTATPGSAALPAESVAAATAQPGDPIAAYVNGAARGDSAVVDISGRQAKVQVGTDYISAAGDRCRRVVLTDIELRKTQVSAVCLANGGWNTVVGL